MIAVWIWLQVGKINFFFLTLLVSVEKSNVLCFYFMLFIYEHHFVMNKLHLNPNVQYFN